MRRMGGMRVAQRDDLSYVLKGVSISKPDLVTTRPHPPLLQVKNPENKINGERKQYSGYLYNILLFVKIQTNIEHCKHRQ